MNTGALSAIPISFWFQLGGMLVSTLITVATFVWFLGRNKSDLDIQMLTLHNEIKMVQSTVHPYAKEIDVSKTRILALTDRITRLEAQAEQTPVDIHRLETRLDRIQNV